jgi:hypothetical protein
LISWKRWGEPDKKVFNSYSDAHLPPFSKLTPVAYIKSPMSMLMIVKTKRKFMILHFIHGELVSWAYRKNLFRLDEGGGREKDCEAHSFFINNTPIICDEVLFEQWKQNLFAEKLKEKN